MRSQDFCQETILPSFRSASEDNVGKPPVFHIGRPSEGPGEVVTVRVILFEIHVTYLFWAPNHQETFQIFLESL